MRGLPFYNDRLSVEAVGFRVWQGRLLGVLITPWFMNLVLVPRIEDEQSRSPEGAATQWEFPAGSYEFNASYLDDSGTHLSAALFSTVQNFPDQDTARAVAQTILMKLFEKTAEKSTVLRDTSDRQPVSRRDLLNKLLHTGD